MVSTFLALDEDRALNSGAVMEGAILWCENGVGTHGR
jgi:hypothetical protein